MALFIEGMPCSLCDQPMERAQGQVIHCLPPFVSNQSDLLWPFSGGACHEECFARHPLAATLSRCLAQREARIRPWPPHCGVCGALTARWEDHFPFGLWTADPEDPLYAFNFLQMHVACVKQFPDLARVQALLEALRASGTWGGPALDSFLESLRAAVETG